MFKIGDRVYPVDSSDFKDCEANKEEMLRLVGVITGVDKCYNRKYEVTWIDGGSGEEAEFSHGFKCAWWLDEELTKDFNQYAERVEEVCNGEVLDIYDISIIASDAIDYLVNDFLPQQLKDRGIKETNPKFDDYIDDILEDVAKQI